MEITITATDANRKFSELLRGVRKGHRYTITSRGEAVATLAVPPTADADDEARRRKAWQKFKKQLNSRPALNLPRATRDEMHER